MSTEHPDDQSFPHNTSHSETKAQIPSDSGVSEDQIASDSAGGALSRKKILVRIAKWIIAAMVAVGLIWATKSSIDQWKNHQASIQSEIEDLDRRLQQETAPEAAERIKQHRSELVSSMPTLANLNWGKIVVSVGLYAIGIFVPGFVLHAALYSLGERPRRKTAIASQLLGHAGKYVPGKAMVIILRVGGLSNDHVGPVRGTISVFMETLLMMAVGAAVACVVIFWLPVPLWMKWSALVVAVLAGIPTAPPILKRVAAKVSNQDSSTVDDSLQAESSLRFFFVGWGWSLISWIFIGASFTMLVSAIPTGQGDLPNLAVLSAVSTAAIALAVVIGFVSLLPGGAGIRELVLTTILATSITMPHALLSALAARVMFMVVEGAGAGLAWIWLRRTYGGDSHD